MADAKEAESASPAAKRVKVSDEPISGTDIPAAAGMATTTASISQEIIPPLHVKRINEKAKVPTRGSAFAAGYDLYA